LHLFTQYVPLKEITTMGLGGPSDYMLDIKTKAELIHTVKFAKTRNSPLLVLGGGSNIVFTDKGFHGVIARIRQEEPEITVLESGKLRVSASSLLDHVISWCCQHSFAGLTCLSGIPGTVGAAPIQNVGAYGSEIGPFIHLIDVFNTRTMQFETLRGSECQFGYRSSHFQQKPHLIIWNVTFNLEKSDREELNNSLLRDEFQTEATSLIPLRRKILDIREAKGMLEHSFRSCGSFFKNPVLNERSWVSLKQKIPRCPSFHTNRETIKIPAAYLIEQAGFKKGEIKQGFGLSPFHALCIIHDGTGRSEALLKFASYIVTSVKNKFDIELQVEPLLCAPNGKPLSLTATETT